MDRGVYIVRRGEINPEPVAEYSLGLSPRSMAFAAIGENNDAALVIVVGTNETFIWSVEEVTTLVLEEVGV